VLDNIALSVGLILLLGLLGGRLVGRLGLPEVIGYLAVGLAIGPHTSGLLSHAAVEALEVIGEIALGVILLSIGAQFHVPHFRRLGRRVFAIALAETFGAALLVGLLVGLISGSAKLALLLGAIAMATAPAATLLVLNQYNAAGPLTDYILAAVALNNVISLVTFRLAVLAVALFGNGDAPAVVLARTAWELAGSVGFGLGLGLLLSWWAEHEEQPTELLMIVLAVALVATGAATAMGLSVMLTTLSMGAVVVNLSRAGRGFFRIMEHTDPPLYVAFFVLSGTHLQPGNIAAVGVLGVVYLIARVVGKGVGATLAARAVGAPAVVQRNLGMALVPQAGMAIGLAWSAKALYPDVGPTILTLVLATVVVYEVVGPILTKLAITRAGEVSAFDDTIAQPGHQPTTSGARPSPDVEE
jgi:Kef-type K+ transport system membrane component KefB